MLAPEEEMVNLVHLVTLDHLGPQDLMAPLDLEEYVSSSFIYSYLFTLYKAIFVLITAFRRLL